MDKECPIFKAAEKIVQGIVSPSSLPYKAECVKEKCEWWIETNYTDGCCAVMFLALKKA